MALVLSIAAVLASTTFWNVLQDVGSIAGLIALLLGVWLSLRAVGVLDRPSYEISAGYLPERDSIASGRCLTSSWSTATPATCR